jgi:hypothetical protein
MKELCACYLAKFETLPATPSPCDEVTTHGEKGHVCSALSVTLRRVSNDHTRRLYLFALCQTRTHGEVYHFVACLLWHTTKELKKVMFQPPNFSPLHIEHLVIYM